MNNKKVAAMLVEIAKSLMATDENVRVAGLSSEFDAIQNKVEEAKKAFKKVSSSLTPDEGSAIVEPLNDAYNKIDSLKHDITSRLAKVNNEIINMGKKSKDVDFGPLLEAVKKVLGE